MALGNATNGVLVTYISPTINVKNTGLTTIFTTQYGMRFIPVEYFFVCDTATSANGDSSLNIGWTAAAYTDFQNTITFTAIVANEWTNTTLFGAPLTVFPASTAIRCNITSGDTGTALTGRIVFVGFYL